MQANIKLESSVSPSIVIIELLGPKAWLKKNYSASIKFVNDSTYTTMHNNKNNGGYS